MLTLTKEMCVVPEVSLQLSFERKTPKRKIIILNFRVICFIIKFKFSYLNLVISQLMEILSPQNLSEWCMVSYSSFLVDKPNKKELEGDPITY